MKTYTPDELKEILAKHAKWSAAGGIYGPDQTLRADLRSADLRSANLYGADLRSANLYGANLYGANLRGANLEGANLRSANLEGANLRSANLYGANLRGANLEGANLEGADLRSADLGGADLRSADLGGANLEGANLRGANLRGANLRSANLGDHSLVPSDGFFIGWKKVQTDAGSAILKLQIAEGAGRVSSLVGRKCRASEVTVLAAYALDGSPLPEIKMYSTHDSKCEYAVGAVVKPDKYDDDIRVECTSGIHFFITRKEAEEYGR